jgi:hypothetical protein
MVHRNFQSPFGALGVGFRTVFGAFPTRQSTEEAALLLIALSSHTVITSRRLGGLAIPSAAGGGLIA